MLRPKVVVGCKIHEDAVKILDEVADVQLILSASKEEIIAEIRDAEAILEIYYLSIETTELLDNTPKLRVLATLGVGYDHIDVEACTRRGVYVVHTPDVLSAAVAELTIGLILCLSRGILTADRYVRTEWCTPHAKDFPYGVDLEGKNLGIIGLGRIGYAVAKRASTFDMKINYYDIVRNMKAESELGVKFVDLETLLREADFVSIHVPLTPETRKMIGERELKQMKRGAFLVNIARGDIIDEAALCRALEERWIAGAGLDVFSEEPLPESPLKKMENVVLTPHIGSATIETLRRVALTNAVDIVRVLKGEEPINLVPEQRGKTFKRKG